MTVQPTFPKPKLWAEEAELMTFINGSDLDYSSLMRRICGTVSHISLQPVTSASEIRRRQQHLRFLLNQPELREALLGSYDTAKVSTDSFTFLNHFSSECETSSRFMDWVQQLEHTFGGIDKMPAEIQKVADFVTDSLSEALKTEKEFTALTRKEVLKAAEFAGNVTISFDRYRGSSNVNDGKVFGYRLHCSDPFKDELWQLPKWIESPGICNWAIRPAARTVIGMRNYRFNRHHFGGQVIDGLPESVQAVAARIAGMIFNPQGGEDPDAVSQAFQQYDWTLMLSINYFDGKLHFEVMDFWPRLQESDKDMGERNERVRGPKFFDLQYFPGFSLWQRWRMERTRQRNVRNHIGRGLRGSITAKGHAELMRRAPKLFDGGIAIEDERVLAEFGYHSLERMFSEDGPTELRELYQRVVHFRSGLEELMAPLRDIAKVASKLSELREYKGYEFAFPQLRATSGGTVEFKTLHPIHLIGQQKRSGDVLEGSDLVPIAGVPHINGRFVGLTGHNGGGKTVVLEAVGYALAMAQTGLPVFGKGFSFNPKTALGLAFIERGAGSTAELLVDKMANIVEAAQAESQDPNRMLALIDEVGTGTQQDAGGELGRRVLATLLDTGCSVMFSTQITTLAETARDDMGAIVLKVDGDRKIDEGIGLGHIDRLVEDSGLGRMLAH